MTEMFVLTNTIILLCSCLAVYEAGLSHYFRMFLLTYIWRTVTLIRIRVQNVSEHKRK